MPRDYTELRNVTKLARCAYCGQYDDRERMQNFWHPVDWLNDGRVVYTVAVYCGSWCAQSHGEADMAVGS